MAKRGTGTWVIIPAHREAGHIADVVRRTIKAGYPRIIVVDDGSPDSTTQEARRAGATVLRHTLNLGKGAALKTGADHAVANGASAVVFIDGDGQHLPEEIPLVLARLRGRTGIVFTYRTGGHRAPRIRRLGGRTISAMIRLFYNLDVRDALCGMRAMTADAYRKVRWTSRDYAVETEMIANAGIRFVHGEEVGISTIYHDTYKGMTVFDGLRILVRLVWWRMTR